MGIANTFPVFEADQVLSKNHLNDLFNYLDQQDRLTRCRLIGCGIVCGLELTYSQQSISISKGTALTSQGYMALHPNDSTDDHIDYTHFLPYTTREFPKGLAFIKQGADASTTTIPFYKPLFETELLQLISQSDFDKLDADQKATATVLSAVPKADLDKYAVVLFLETEQLNLKNCDTNDCNDKGSRMDFDVKMLLVKKTVLDNINKDNQNNVIDNAADDELRNIHLKRYNVPVSNLTNSSDVLNAFEDLVEDAVLNKIEQVFSSCYTNYKFLLENELQDPFTNLGQTLIKLRDKIIKDNPVLIQYFYDFIDDLVKAYHEFTHNLVDTVSECCGNEMRFPLHIMLGEANANTHKLQHNDAYRQYFIYSPLFDSQAEKLEIVRMLFRRLRLMIDEFSITEMTGFSRKDIRITPSSFGRTALSKRCIPYYYQVAENGKELYRSWDYDKTKKGKAKTNLSYNANDYSNANAVVTPLRFDLEAYDFFRVEGHIGKGINDALIRIKQEQQRFNLPFDTVALSADYIGALVKGEEPTCLIQDLESDYRVLIAEFVCLVHEPLCLASKVKYTGRQTVFPGVIKTPLNNLAAIGNFKLMSAHAPTALGAFAFAGIATGGSAAGPTTSPGTTTAAPPVDVPDDEDEDKLVVNALNLLPAATDHIFVSTLVNEYQAVKKYQKGDTLARLCNPTAGFVGNKYISIIKSNNGEFRNPVPVNASGPNSPLFHELFEFIDRAESTFKILMSAELAELNINTFKSAFRNFENELKNLKRVSPRIASELEMTFDSCVVERLEALKNEYQRRTAQYKLAKNFNYYFKKHGGIEHKAGVPKGGTFILVYHEERRNRLIDVKSIFINKELSSIMMTHFQSMLKPAVKINHLEFQSKLLQTATLYKEPELYMRFKDVMTKYLDECHDLPEDRRKEIKDIISKPPEAKNKFELTNEMVIADFYVPYMCCSDCPPIAYILPQPQKDETADPTIKIDKNKFCNSDNTNFNIDITPPGGELTGAGVKKTTDGRFVFSPLGLPAGLHNITYKINDKSISAAVEVVATPKTKFSIRTTVEAAQMTVFITNESTDIIDQATTYKWLLDGVEFSTKKDPEDGLVKFKVDTLPRTIKLTAANGACPSEFSVTINPEETEERAIAVCSTLTELKLEPNLPQGADISMLADGGIVDNSLAIHPKSLGLAATKEFQASYVIDHKRINTRITIIVVNAEFTLELKKAIPPLTSIHIPVTPVTLTLKSLDGGLTRSEWLISQQGNPNPPLTNIADGTPVPLQPRFDLSKPISITHVAGKTINGASCGQKKQFQLTAGIIEVKLNKPPFDSNFHQ